MSVFVLIGCLVGLVVAGDAPRPPTEKDRCEICGMYVSKYPNWVATIVFRDGSQVFFDGGKDFFRFLLSFEESRNSDRQISAVFVTDYYRVKPINAETAFFVSGSDVMGPMGAELVPLASREEAESFARDHGGEEILAFGDVTLAKISR